MNIISFALKTRLCIILLQILSNGLIVDHDAGDVFISPQEGANEDHQHFNWFNWCIDVTLGGFARWDAQHFLHIATHGYSYEQTLAFYPFFPCVVSAIVHVMHFILPFISLYNSCLIVAIALNVVFFTMATECLYELSVRLTGNRKWAQTVAVLFCLNPASIFFTAPYSEALFAWCTFKLMLQTLSPDGISLWTAIPLSVSIITRSNGLISVGFVAYAALKMCFVQSKKVNRVSVMRISFAVCLIAAITYASLQAYFYYRFCGSGKIHHQHHHHPQSIRSYALEKGFKLAGDTQPPPTWCNYSIPISYSYVQSTYWNVGFLRYYQLKQTPNFLLAAPILSILLYYCFNYVRMNFRYSLYLGLFETKINNKITLFERQIFPFIIHGLFLTLFCLFFVHIQVSTRLLASTSPLLYWYCANFFKDTSINGFHDIYNIIRVEPFGPRSLILLYFIGYSFVGTILFTNFFPWT